MDKTQFAGLTRLDPGDPLSIDNSSFQARNPSIIDRYLQLGAVTHRHDAHVGLANPSSTPSASAVSSGGTIPADLSLTVGYTLNDSSGGETILAPQTVVSTAPGWNPPETQLVATVDYSSGSLLANTYHYCITLIDGMGGETAPGSYVSAEREPGYPSGNVTVTGLNSDFGVNNAAGWRLYRATGGEEFGFLATGTASAFVDTGSVNADCGQQPPDDGDQTTNNANSLQIRVPSGGAMGSAASFNLYITPDGDFGGGTFIDTYPVSSAGALITLASIDLAPQSPPDVSTCVQGASKIDPDTDLLDWHWKRPVAGSGALPSGSQGDVRMTLNNGHLWGVVGSAGAVNYADWTDLGGALSAQEVGGPLYSGRSTLRFTGSGATVVGVSDDGSGQSTVTISSTGGGSVVDAAGSGGVDLVTPVSHFRFAGSGGQGVAVQNIGGGSAQVLLGTPPAGSSPATLAVEDEDGPVLGPPISYLKFAASGGTGISTSSLGGGSAQVLVSGGGGGIVAGSTSVSIAASGGADAVNPITHVRFAGSGEQGVAIQNMGGGSAQVLLYSPADTAAGSGGVSLVSPTPNLRFAGSGGAGVAVQNIGGGSAQVLIGAGSGGGGSVDAAGSAGVSLVTPVSHFRFAGSGGTGVAVQNVGGGSAQVLISASGSSGGGGGGGLPHAEVKGNSDYTNRLNPQTYSGYDAIQLSISSVTSENGSFSTDGNALVLPAAGLWTLGMQVSFDDAYPGAAFPPSGSVGAMIRAFDPNSGQYEEVAYQTSKRVRLEDSDGGGINSRLNTIGTSWIRAHDVITMERTYRLATSGSGDALHVKWYVWCADVGNGGYINIGSPVGEPRMWATKLCD